MAVTPNQSAQVCPICLESCAAASAYHDGDADSSNSQKDQQDSNRADNTKRPTVCEVDTYDISNNIEDSNKGTTEEKEEGNDGGNNYPTEAFDARHNDEMAVEVFDGGERAIYIHDDDDDAAMELHDDDDDAAMELHDDADDVSKACRLVRLKACKHVCHLLCIEAMIRTQHVRAF